MMRTLAQNLFEQTFITDSDDKVMPDLIHQKRFQDDIEVAIANCSGGWSISQDLARFLAHAVATLNSKNILEFGAGSSSLVLANSLSVSGGGKLTSIEQNPVWCTETWKLVNDKENVDSFMIVAQPKLSLGISGVYFCFKDCLEDIAYRGLYDLVLIDAPQYFFGRDGAVPIIYNYLAPNALIVMDDAERYNDRWTLFRWLRSYPGLKLVYYNPTFTKKGLAILRFQSRKSPRFSLVHWMTSLQDTGSLLLSPGANRQRKGEF